MIGEREEKEEGMREGKKMDILVTVANLCLLLSNILCM